MKVALMSGGSSDTQMEEGGSIPSRRARKHFRGNGIGYGICRRIILDLVGNGWIVCV
jgi:hypothetical protein